MQTRTSGRPQHVLICGINYWPEETGIAPYTTGLAEHLAAGGSRVTVITGMPHYPRWRITDGYRGRRQMRESIGGVDVRRYGHYVPRRQSAARRALFEGTFLAHALPVSSLTPMPRPDVVLGIVPNLGTGLLAAAAAKRFGVPYGLLFQDLMGLAAEQSGIAGGGRVARAAATLEAWLARGAAGVGVVAEGFCDYFLRNGVAPERMTHLPNWSHIPPPRLARETVRVQLGWDAGTQVVVHAGNMGLKQALEHVIDAARIATRTQPNLRFVLMGDGSQRPALESRAAGLPNITFLDPQPAERFPDILHAADILLVNERATVTDMSLPSKLTSYFVAGRPVVAAVPADGATERAVLASGAGLVTPAESPTALLAALDRLAADAALCDQLAQAGPRHAAQHLYAGAALDRAAAFIDGLHRTPVALPQTLTSRGAA
ncbi:MAG: WcaI family glycosyltransferase [Dehalococcoidia bacterium]